MVRKSIKITLIVISIVCILSVILYAILGPPLQVYGGIIDVLPAAPLFLLGIGMVFLLPVVTFQYFRVIRKSKMAQVSQKFRAYVRRVL